MAPEKVTDSATLAYLEKNKYLVSLPKFTLGQGRQRPFPGRSAVRLLWIKLRSVPGIVRGIIKTAYHYSKLSRLAKLKGTGTGRSALVLGNGPSQGFLDPKKLRRFIQRDNHLFAVNFYINNKTLSPICPNYYVISDPVALKPNGPSRLIKKVATLREYFEKNEAIKICVPTHFDLDNNFKARAVYFNDLEACWWSKNINPLFPRGYLSATLYKALALACFIGYKKIYVLGMDNTYPHDIFVDRHNNVCNTERHSGDTDHMIDQSPWYKRTEDVLWDLCLLFYDLKQFQCFPIVNLDPYSLTNAFPKADNEKTMEFLFDEII